MTIEEMIARREVWQNRAETDYGEFGPWHAVTQIDVEMVLLYDSEIEKAAKQYMRDGDGHELDTPDAAPLNAGKLEAESRRADADDNRPARLHREGL